MLRSRFSIVFRERKDSFDIDTRIEGDFQCDKKGGFRTYFHIGLNEVGRIVRLDIGQVDHASEDVHPEG
jgi:hypothetical protein